MTPLTADELKELRVLSSLMVGNRDAEEQDRYSELLERYSEAGGPIEATRAGDQAFINAVMFAAEGEDFTVQSYSGRGMYGKMCLGVALPSSADVLKLGYWLGVDDNSERNSHHVGDVQIDDLGRGVILYWPSIKLKDEEPL